MRLTWGGSRQEGWDVLDIAGVDAAGLTAARRWVRGKLAMLGEDDRSDALMVAGELLDNAFLHAGGPRELRLRLDRDPCRVVLAVADNGRGEPRLRPPDHRGGRGLLLVQHLSRQWGVSHHDDGKLVWACLDCAGLQVA